MKATLLLMFIAIALNMQVSLCDNKSFKYSIIITQTSYENAVTFVYNIKCDSIIIYGDNDEKIYSSEISKVSIFDINELIPKILDLKDEYIEVAIDGIYTSVKIYEGENLLKNIVIENTNQLVISSLIKIINRNILQGKYKLHELS